MAAGVESLSVNAAAAVLLFEAARKRRQVISAG
jgi:tRNA G18 (ribose-2'-O)-methylase SpoU